MEKTFSKHIDKLDVVQNLGLNSDVICRVGWYYAINNIVNDTQRHIYFETDLDISNIESFVNYEDLTEAQVIQWIESTISDSEDIEIKNKLNRIMNIFEGGLEDNKKLPWNT